MKLTKLLASSAYLLAMLLSLSLCGCADTDDRPSIVCSSALVADWTEAVLGEDSESCELYVLGARGSDIHSYEPTVRDIAKIAQCSLLVRIGGESEDWADEVKKSARNTSMLELELTRVIELECEEHTHSHDHKDKEILSSDTEAHAHTDEHIWFSFEHVYKSVEGIKDALTTLKPECAQLYEQNAAVYIDKIRKLEGEYKALAESAECKSIVVCDRFPFLYLCEYMGLEYAAAYEGCSAESEASFSVVSALAKRIDEWQLSYVIKTESSDGAVADAVISATKNKAAKTLTLDSMQSMSADDIGQKSYLGMLESNLEVLRIALTK